MKKRVVRYAPVKVGKCPKCHCSTNQKLVDYNYTIYKCTKCGNIHA